MRFWGIELAAGIGVVKGKRMMASCSKTCGYPHHQGWFPTYFFGGWIPWIPKTTKKKLYNKHKQHNKNLPPFFVLRFRIRLMFSKRMGIKSVPRWQFSSSESIPCLQVTNKLSEVQVLMGILCQGWVGATHHKTRTRKGLSFQQGETKALWHSMK